MDRIDFRSDTVSWPTPEMREAMARAEVGDDVYGEDPTVNRLQQRSAELLGKEAGLFVASGTMGNLCAVLAWAGRGDEAILGYDSHPFQWEAGSMAALGGVFPHVLPTDRRGRMDLQRVEEAVRDTADAHHARTRLILVENSFGGRGGAALPAEYFAAVREIADRHALAVHLDGARLFNAAVALEVEPALLARDVDSVTFCLSKGLCAPVGSVVCGSSDFIERAHRARKSLGGGMRQAGILAAAGLVALDTSIERLADDHRHARALAEGLVGLPGVVLDLDGVQTNIVHFELGPEVGFGADGFAARMREGHDILVGTYPVNLVRAVTHRWVGMDEVDAFLSAAREVLAAAARG
jgi:threonine aldolase